MLDSRPRGLGFEPHLRHCVLSLSKNINTSFMYWFTKEDPSLYNERLLMGHKESNQTKQKTTPIISNKHVIHLYNFFHHLMAWPILCM